MDTKVVDPPLDIQEVISVLAENDLLEGTNEDLPEYIENLLNGVSLEEFLRVNNFFIESYTIGSSDN